MWTRIGNALALFILGVTALLCSCSASKKSSQEKSTIENNSTHKADSLEKELFRISEKYESLLSEKESNKLDFEKEPCPPQEIKIDSNNCREDSLIAIIQKQAAIINNQKSKIKMYADGSWEATGKISSFSTDLQKMQKQVHEVNIENDRLKTYSDSLATQLNIAKSARTKEKTNIWPWIIIGFVLATVLWKWKWIYSLIKKISI